MSFTWAELFIVDELRFVPFDHASGELLFNLLSERYKRQSTLITTNLAFSEWGRVFRDAKLTTALLDHLGHHSHILTIPGFSHRNWNEEQGSQPYLHPTWTKGKGGMEYTNGELKINKRAAILQPGVAKRQVGWFTFRPLPPYW